MKALEENAIKDQIKKATTGAIGVKSSSSIQFIK
jgi:hypothetical protein